MTSKRCWALHANYGRCEKDAGHDDDHAIVLTWPDDACVDVGPIPSPVMTKTGGRDVPIIETSAEEPAPGSKCFTCSHTRDQHDYLSGCLECDCLGWVE